MSVNNKDLWRMIFADGWIILRQAGSHIRVEHPVKGRKTVVSRKKYEQYLVKQIKKDLEL